MLAKMYPPTARVSTVLRKNKVADLPVGNLKTGTLTAQTLATAATLGDNMLGWILGAMAYDTLRNLNETLREKEKREQERDRRVRAITRKNSKKRK